MPDDPRDSVTLPDGTSLEGAVSRLRDGDRAMLARCITLVESRRPDHRRVAAALLQAILPYTGEAWRVGITGVPGVGKSTTIDQLGVNLTAGGHRVAVLAVDPSSQRTGGSILGDKTRMARLAVDPSAFIRPSPASGTLGGVAARTRETMLVCEAAGFDVVIVETVGTGQSETAVSEMVDVFVVLALPGAGDELQGIKKGVLEIADIIAVNKADGDNADRARRAAAECRAALHILTPQSRHWSPPVLAVSGRDNVGLDDLWEKIAAHRDAMKSSHEFDERRADQQVRWMWAMLEERLLGLLRADPEISARIDEIEAQVHAGTLAPTAAVEEIAPKFGA
ncbi:methylmalonyl Co-A mutase-associated GTPase MeaB [Microbaculum marinum]|uniref:Methylmalonyl Co-A mutase-associated GTPase MeaB n=1 Tax=Microbaculum marinum TaxID=1764581 RepID=A0AAW9RCK8_9HYPH